jgi:hypothetical protein
MLPGAFWAWRWVCGCELFVQLASICMPEVQRSRKAISRRALTDGKYHLTSEVVVARGEITARSSFIPHRSSVKSGSHGDYGHVPVNAGSISESQYAKPYVIWFVSTLHHSTGFHGFVALESTDSCLQPWRACRRAFGNWSGQAEPQVDNGQTGCYACLGCRA